MNDNELKLFKVETRGCGDFHVVSTDFNAAAQAVSDELNAQDYGYSNDRHVTRVEFLMRQRFMEDCRRALYGDDDENHFIIDGDIDIKQLEHRYAEQLAKLSMENEKLKTELDDCRRLFEERQQKATNLAAEVERLRVENERLIKLNENNNVDGTSGDCLIAEERRRQITEEGYDSEHDRKETCLMLTKAAVAYAIADMPGKGKTVFKYWPWMGDMLKLKDHKRNLVRAGALIAAAIDRLKQEEEEKASYEIPAEENFSLPERAIE